ncbi:hypothetical protein COL922a_006858 [Colletotrichum nupharicola]|nr:hypothetical protein COL922a_006858 [Colletotrichum nupharicola]
MSPAEDGIKLGDRSPNRVNSNPDSPVTLNDKTQAEATADPTSDDNAPKSGGRGWAFWAIFASLSVTALLSSMEGGIMSTALPAISRAVDAERDYIWVVNVYFLTGDEDSTPLEKLKRIDVFGLLLLCASVTSLLYGLTYGGGSKYAWSHPVIIITLVLGVIGHGLFIGFEASPWCPHPALPISLFQNRTSVAAYVAEAVQILVSYGAVYFLPLYFQSTLLVYPERSGILLLPFSILFCISAAVGGGLVTNMGKFRMVHIGSFALMTIMMGVFTLLNRNTHLAVIAITGIITGISVGLPNASILTAVQAALPDSLNAASTSAFAFIRSISTVFAITIPAAIFNSRFDGLLSSSTLDSNARASLGPGQAYQQGSRDFVRSFPDAVQNEIIGLYEVSLQRVWQVLIAIAGLGVIASLIEKDLECRTEQTTEEFGLKEEKPGQTSSNSEV